MNFWRNFSLDRLSFWLGFLAGSLFWFVAVRLWPLLRNGIEKVKTRLQQAGKEVIGDVQERYRKELLRHVQGVHLAAPLFALDEVLIPPRVLLEHIPPASEEEAAQVSGPDAVTASVHWTPDRTEMAAFYHARSAPLVEVLADGAHLALIAPPGYGKTVALAALASALARRDPALGERREALPLWAHAADLDLEAEDPVQTLSAALGQFLGTLTRAQMPSLLRDHLIGGQAVLLLDGLDELPPARQEAVIRWLSGLTEEYPALQVVVGADTGFFDGLLRLGCVPLALSAWSEEEREQFLSRWAHAWDEYVRPDLSTREDAPPAVDSLLLTGWLREGALALSPLELTLRAWGAFAGDLTGGQPHHAITSHLRRLVKPDHLSALQTLAAVMLANQESAFSPKQASAWLGEPPAEEAPQLDEDEAGAEESAQEGEKQPPTHLSRRALDEALDHGLLIEGSDETLRFVHPVLAGHLAGQEMPISQEALHRFDWAPMRAALHSAAVHQPNAPWIEALLDQSNPPLFWRLSEVARWLPDAPRKAAWRVETLRRLAVVASNARHPLTVRQSAALALTLSGDPGALTLFRKLLTADDPQLRQIAALNLGMLHDKSSVHPLSDLLLDPHPPVGQAAALALAAIGGQNALNELGILLLHGEEQQRRTAAEALANDRQEGHAMLQEAITLDDILVRRAAIYGLMRIEAPWAYQALEKMQFEDEWVVKNAAAQALEEIAYRKAHRLDRTRPLTETPWLIEFAASEGMGVAPGAPAIQMLLRALQHGNENQRLLAARRLRSLPLEGAIAPLYHALYGANDLEFRETVWLTLWHQRAGGIPLPPPQQFGLG